MLKKNLPLAFVCVLLATLTMIPVHAGDGDPLRRTPILQFFATSWNDIHRRLPEIVDAGYGALWLPPPQKAGTGAFSVGYDPADRFDLGDRFQYGTVNTMYGSTHDLIELIKAAHQLGLEVYFDLVANHNGNRFFVGVDGYPDVIPQDFHIFSTNNPNNNEIFDFNAFSFQNLNNDLLGLADFAQEDGNKILADPNPLPPGVVINAFDKPSFFRHPFVPQYYPSAPPAAEDVREFLGRWGEWMGSTIGADGYRLDAVRHTPPPFFGGPSSFTAFDGTVYDVSTPSFLSRLEAGVWQRAGKSAYVFGEDLSGFGLELGIYADTGMLLLDFPLRFNIANVYNSNGFGDVGATFSNSPGVFGITFEYGGIDGDVGVTFLQSHDDNAPTSNNLASAHVLTRVGRPIVYFDGNNVADDDFGNFPRPGRSDALGEVDGLTTDLVGVHNQFARGDMTTRWSANDLFVFERIVGGQGILLVGLNDRGDRTEFGAQSATVQTAFPPGTQLIDYSGQMGPLTVNGAGQVFITVPTNNDPSNDPPAPPPPGVFCNDDTCFENNGRGFVLYAPATPQALPAVAPIVLEQDGAPLPLQSFPTVDGSEADPEPGTVFEAPVVTGDQVTLRIRTDSLGASAVVRIDDGAPINNRTPLVGTPEGLFDGFVNADTAAAGVFEIVDVDASGLGEGLHVVRAAVLAAPQAGIPTLFNNFSQLFFIDRPETGGVVVDGSIPDDFESPRKARQLVDPSPSEDGVNELNALFLEADDRNLYIGVSGVFNGTRSGAALDGVVIFIDTDFGRQTGVNNFDDLNDDSGPAARLLSNSRVTGPPSFGAELAAAAFRAGGLNNAPTAPFVADFAVTPPVGARSGVYRIDPGALDDLIELPGMIAFNPDHVAVDGPAAVNPLTGEESDGLEIALRLDDLYPDCDGDGVPGNDNEDGGLPQQAQLALVAYLTTTGETGVVTGAASQPGGRPAAVGSVKNQFLPAHPQIQTAPGQNPVILTHAVVATAGRLRQP